MSSSTHTSRPQRNFRPWPDNQAQFAFAEAQRLNVSELLNEIVAKHFKRHVAAKLAATQRELVRQFGPGRVRSQKTPAPKLTKHRN